MLRFKQFLLIEGGGFGFGGAPGSPFPADKSVTINQRKYLESIYGKENAEIMFSKVREREAELGGTEQFLKYADQYAIEKQKQKEQQKEQQKIKDQLPGLGLNPDLVGPLSGDPISDSDVESRARAASGMNDTQINTFNTFAVPIYSDKNLDRPIDVKVTKMKLSPTLAAAGYKDAGAASAIPVGNKPENEKGTIKVNQDYWWSPWAKSEKGIYAYPNYKKNSTTNLGDDIGHELTHTGQPDWDYDLNSSDRRAFPQTEYNSNEPASKETIARRTYTQDPFEPAARMSEIKHLYYGRTGKLLPADMTPEDKTNFQSWYKTSDIRSPEFDDTVQLLDTPEGDELFKRVTKVNKPDTSDTRMT